MLKLRLYRFLSIFIPYYRRKMRDINELLSFVNNAATRHLKKYSNCQSFHIISRQLATENDNSKEVSIKYTIQYQAVQFDVRICIDSEKVKISSESYSQNLGDETIDIGKFLTHFKNIQTRDLIMRYKVFIQG